MPALARRARLHHSWRFSCTMRSGRSGLLRVWSPSRGLHGGSFTWSLKIQRVVPSSIEYSPGEIISLFTGATGGSSAWPVGMRSFTWLPSRLIDSLRGASRGIFPMSLMRLWSIFFVDDRWHMLLWTSFLDIRRGFRLRLWFCLRLWVRQFFTQISTSFEPASDGVGVYLMGDLTTLTSVSIASAERLGAPAEASRFWRSHGTSADGTTNIGVDIRGKLRYLRGLRESSGQLHLTLIQLRWLE